jgi:hypothetical protein
MSPEDRAPLRYGFVLGTLPANEWAPLVPTFGQIRDAGRN